MCAQKKLSPMLHLLLLLSSVVEHISTSILNEDHLTLQTVATMASLEEGIIRLRSEDNAANCSITPLSLTKLLNHDL